MPDKHGAPFQSSTRSFWALSALCALVCAGAVAAWGLGWLEYTFAELERMIASAGPWAPAMVIALMIVHCFVPFPAEVLALCAGAIFGVIWGTALIWVGAMVGASLSFGLARWLGRDAVARVLPARQAAKLDNWAKEQGTVALLVSRLIPVIAFNLINYAAGLTRVGWGTFLWTTAVGIVPLTVLMVWFGAQMRELSWPVLLSVSAAGIAVIVAGHYVRRRSG